MPTSKLRAPPRGLIEVHEDLQVVSIRRPPVRAQRKALDDPRRARQLVGGRGRPAHEDPAAAGCVTRTADGERPRDGQTANVRKPRGVERVERAPVGLEFPRVLHERSLEEGHADVVRTGRHWHLGSQSAVDFGGALRAFPSEAADGSAADRRDEDALAVHRELELIGVLEPSRLVHIGPHQRRRQRVLAVHREGMADDDTADGAERLPLDVLVLRQVLPDHVGLRADRHVEVADGHRRDASRRGDVTLGQQRREAECVRDVVEAVCRFIGRQERGDVADVHRQQIANGVGVLRTVHAVRQRTARTRRGGCGAIEPGLQPRDQSQHGRLVGMRHARRRHGSQVELAKHLLPDLGVGCDVREIFAGQHQPAGLGAFAVAGDAVPAERGLVRGNRRWRTRRTSRRWSLLSSRLG